MDYLDIQVNRGVLEVLGIQESLDIVDLEYLDIAGNQDILVA